MTPVRKSFTREELQAAVLRCMREVYGTPPQDDREARNRWYENLGLLTVFVTDLWERSASPTSGDA